MNVEGGDIYKVISVWWKVLVIGTFYWIFEDILVGMRQSEPIDIGFKWQMCSQVEGDLIFAEFEHLDASDVANYLVL